jgi:hypothetical protein
MFFEEYQKWFKSAAYITEKRTEDGKRIFIHFVQDINERKKAEEELVDNIEELEKWQRLTTNKRKPNG